MGRDPMLEPGKSVRSPPPEEEGVAETTWEELTQTPHSPSPCAARQGEEVEKTRSKVKPGKKGGVGGRCFKIWFYFSLSCSDLTGNKLIFFPKSSLFCP